MRDTPFHPFVARWFAETFDAPTDIQRAGWRAITAGSDTLIAAPTGSGKTLAAFLWAIDNLVREAKTGRLEDRIHVVYVSPLKALGNDIEKNLRAPLAGIRALASEAGVDLPEIRVAVRTGDTPARERELQARRPPHILITTPESLYILLTAGRSRAALREAATVIVDEIHAVAPDKRGTHLALSLERLDALAGRPLQRIGLSATQKPVEDVARLLVGAGRADENPREVSRGAPAGQRPRAGSPGGSPSQGAERIGAHGSPGGSPSPQVDLARQGAPACVIVDAGHRREMTLSVETPDIELGPMASRELREAIHDRIADLVRVHRTTIVFVHTRRMVERVAHALGERIGKERVAAHHGALSRETRLAAEEGLKSGAIPVIVATASLELGIDVGHVDLVCHLGAPRSLASLLQRVGRSGHFLGAVPRGILFPLTLDDLLQSAAAVRAVHAGELDRLSIPENALDILAQQIVAIAATGEIAVEDLWRLVRRAWPFRNLKRHDFDAVIEMLSEGVSTRRGRRSTHLHHDLVHGMLRPRRGARLAAITSGGAIPDTADYDVVEEPAGRFVGKVNEDFAVESLQGDVFLLGNRSWRIRRVEAGKVRVVDAEGAASTIPFWLGEGPARTAELSAAVADLRREVAGRCHDVDAAAAWIVGTCGVDRGGAEQIVRYVADTLAVLGAVPTLDTVIAERFFDEAGGMQLVLHAPFGGRVNRALGLLLRKRFCVGFDFELQAAATDDGIVLSLGEQHSFPLDSVFGMITSGLVGPPSGRDLTSGLVGPPSGWDLRSGLVGPPSGWDLRSGLVGPPSGRDLTSGLVGPPSGRDLRERGFEDDLLQAVLVAPMFTNRWRWNVTRSLALLRHSGGRRVPMPIQRMRAEDLLAAVFPAQLACQDNNPGGPIEPPDHPLVNETIANCLREAMDTDGLRSVLEGIAHGTIRALAVETRAPSPMSHEILNANPYAFLDDAPLEERRARAVSLRRVDPDLASGIGALDPGAIAEVRAQAWPDVRDADEAQDALHTLCLLPEAEASAWREHLDALVATGRATRVRLPEGMPAAFVAAERIPLVRAAFGEARLETPLPLRAGQIDMEEAMVTIVRGWMESIGPASAQVLAGRLALPRARVESALARLEGEGVVLRGRYTAGAQDEEWCDRVLLARIHRMTLGRLRREIEAVSAADFMRFLLRWQHVQPGQQLHGRDGLRAVIGQLQGLELPGPAWERDVLPARVAEYDPRDLEQLCLAGDVAWGRLAVAGPSEDEEAIAPSPRRRQAPTRSAPLAFALREDLPSLLEPLPADRDFLKDLSPIARDTFTHLETRGASFLADVARALDALPGEVEDALWELVTSGLVTGDGIAGLRTLLLPEEKRAPRKAHLRALPGRGARRSQPIGRWSLLRPEPLAALPAPEAAEASARRLLARYGVLFREVRLRERRGPSWRSLLQALRRLEARGEIRGGRFVDGFVGEQFALPEAVDALRAVRRSKGETEIVLVAAADPLNLVGLVTPGPRVSPFSGHVIAWRDGVPVEIGNLGAVRSRLQSSNGVSS